MDILNKYPELRKQFEIHCQLRRNDILTHMLETDNLYNEHCRKRADLSIKLKKTLMEFYPEATPLFEEYADAVYAQEIYELDTIYKQAFIDALIILQNQGLL